MPKERCAHRARQRHLPRKLLRY